MGASLVYLEKPNKEIQFDLGENSQLKYAAAGMQGWRINMVSDCKRKNLKMRSKMRSLSKNRKLN